MKYLVSILTLGCALRVHAAEPSLPEPLVAKSGARIANAAAWQSQRRPELLELFRENIYGRMPVRRPDSLKFETIESSTNVMDGKATRKQVKISYRGPGGEGSIKLILFSPNRVSKPPPCFLLICNRSITNIDPSRAIKSEFWPAEEIIARGYAAAAFFNGDVVPDKLDAFKRGAHAIFDPTAGRSSNSWGTIAAWAWGASRCLDYLETDRSVDVKRVAVIGHSRGGKTALWAGAEDERFAFVISNDSGSTGAAIARNKEGEHIHDINRGFPYWFCDNYKQFNDREDALPIDQHELLALIAPRLLYVASAVEDKWSDPKNEFLATIHASPVYELLGQRGIGTKEFPKIDSPVQNGDIGYHVRSGKHNLTLYDWHRYMDFADKHWGGAR